MIHLVTYATPRFRLRQLILGWSARVNRVADTVTHWTPEKLLSAGFELRCKDVKLAERGSGFWAWKPFIIEAKLRDVSEGDLVFYCDVGRLYPFKLLSQPVHPYLQWMDEQDQDVMPGIEIPWDGPNLSWIKRECLVAMGMDCPSVHFASPIQASFSLWRASERSRQFAARWMNACAQRALVSDDPSGMGLSELPGFRGHRHDQALLTLCCIADGIHGLGIGIERPDIDSRHPSAVSRMRFGKKPGYPSVFGRILRGGIWPFERVEQKLRGKVRFGRSIQE
jgi:hypothetical protein